MSSTIYGMPCGSAFGRCVLYRLKNRCSKIEFATERCHREFLGRLVARYWAVFVFDLKNIGNYPTVCLVDFSWRGRCLFFLEDIKNYWRRWNLAWTGIELLLFQLSSQKSRGGVGGVDKDHPPSLYIYIYIHIYIYREREICKYVYVYVYVYVYMYHV